ncbi:MAG: tolB protein precursor [Bacteroidota bacterium]
MNVSMKFVLFLALSLLMTQVSFSQYFGQNKVNYEKFDFKIYETPHFQIYNYLDNKRPVQDLGRQSEQWYQRHFSIFRDTVLNNPLILYNNHADFQQTTVISGLINVGTGGVTEGFRKRVVMPFMGSNRETDHILGHEMVHVFQYNMIHKDDSLGFESLRNLPLWMVEGLAEYMSIGPSDNKTAMWMRDAVLQDDIPSIKDMTRKQNEYFPYRYGHAFWSFLTGIWGDAMIKPVLYTTAKYGVDRAVDSLFGISKDSLSTLWQNSVKQTYEPYIQDSIKPVGEPLFTAKNSGDLNLSPVLSPDGENVAFLTNKNVISIDLMVANTETREIIKKLTSTIRKSHIDDFNYIESSGSWSADGNSYVLTTFSKGRNKLLIADVEGNNVKVKKEIAPEGVRAFNNPEWSPDGNKILINGLVDGQSDLYVYDLKQEEVEQLTDDKYSDLHASWSSDGENIVFISGRGPDTDLSKQKYGKYRLCTLDIKTKDVDVVDVFADSDIYSPNYSSKDTAIYFLSHADGYRNLYEYNIPEDKVYKMTDFVTGISGITDLAPAYSVAQNTGKFAYTLYGEDSYHTYFADKEDFSRKPVERDFSDKSAEVLPPDRTRNLNIVETNLNKNTSTPDSSYKDKPYKPKFQLEYIGSGGVGVGTSQFGTYASGGVSALFNDVLKRHQIFTTLNVQGEIYDIGGYAAYINKETRFNWGGSYSHFPYRYFTYGYSRDTTDWDNDGDQDLVEDFTEYRQRIFEDQFSLFGQYPLSRKLRFEAGATISRYSFRVDSINTRSINGIPFKESREEISTRDPYYVGRGHIAYVGDDSNNGITGPLSGYRYRFQVEKMFARYDLYGTLLDFRKYFFNKPLSLGFRTLHYARYGKDENELYNMYVGNYYFVRGYTYNSFDNRSTSLSSSKLNPSNLQGSKMGVFNAEIRFPLSGPKRLTLFESKYFYSTLVGFFDGGFATSDYDDLEFSWDPVEGKHTPVFSSGLALRVNLFGYLILEPYIAKPFQRSDKEYSYGLVIRGFGW